MMEVDRWHAAVLFDQHIEKVIHGISSTRSDQFTHALADECLVLRVRKIHQQHRIPVTAYRQKMVVPIRKSIQYVCANPRAQLRITKALQHFCVTTVMDPWRDDGA